MLHGHMIYDPGKGGGTSFGMVKKHTVRFTCAYTHLLVKHAWHDVMGVQVFVSMKKSLGGWKRRFCTMILYFALALQFLMMVNGI